MDMIKRFLLVYLISAFKITPETACSSHGQSQTDMAVYLEKIRVHFQLLPLTATCVSSRENPTYNDELSYYI